MLGSIVILGLISAVMWYLFADRRLARWLLMAVGVSLAVLWTLVASNSFDIAAFALALICFLVGAGTGVASVWFVRALESPGHNQRGGPPPVR